MSVRTSRFHPSPHSVHSYSPQSAPLAFAPTPGSPPRATSTRQSPPPKGMSGPLAAHPPPPLNYARYNPSKTYGPTDHTLGPMFSDEEDGDDSEYIAMQMAHLGLHARGHSLQQRTYAQPDVRREPSSRAPPHAQHHADMHSRQPSHGQSDQQRILQSILSSSRNDSRDTHRVLPYQADTNPNIHAQMMMQAQAHAQRALLTAQLQQQQQQQQQQRQAHFDTQQHLQQLHFTALQQQPSPYASVQDQRSALTAQVQANLHARTARGRMKSDDTELRARFEGAPNTEYKTPVTTAKPVFAPLPSPFASSSSWQTAFSSTTVRAAPHEPMRNMSISQGQSRPSRPDGQTLSAFLSRRRATEESSGSSEAETASDPPSRIDTAQTSPNSSIFEQDKAKGAHADAHAFLGLGRPTNGKNATRSCTMPNPGLTFPSKPSPSTTKRSASLTIPVAVRALRQPLGPPGETELKSKNFQARLRKQAGLGLGMLTRRVESPCPTPVLA